MSWAMTSDSSRTWDSSPVRQDSRSPTRFIARSSLAPTERDGASGAAHHGSTAVGLQPLPMEGVAHGVAGVLLQEGHAEGRLALPGQAAGEPAQRVLDCRPL